MFDHATWLQSSRLVPTITILLIHIRSFISNSFYFMLFSMCRPLCQSSLFHWANKSDGPLLQSCHRNRSSIKKRRHRHVFFWHKQPLYQYEAKINNASVLNHIIPLRNLKWIKQYSSIVSEVNSLETKRHMQNSKDIRSVYWCTTVIQDALSTS
jgi:hypothetical protein